MSVNPYQIGASLRLRYTEDQRWIKFPDPLVLVRRRPVVLNSKRDTACCIALRRGEFSSLLADASFDSVQTREDVGRLAFCKSARMLMHMGIAGLITSRYSTRTITSLNGEQKQGFPLLHALQNAQNAQDPDVDDTELLQTQLCKPLVGKHALIPFSNSLQDAVSQWFRPYRDSFQGINLEVLHNLPRVFWLTGDHHTEIVLPRSDAVGASIRLGPTRTGAFGDYDIESGVVEPLVRRNAMQPEVYNRSTHAGKECYIVFLVLKRR